MPMTRLLFFVMLPKKGGERMADVGKLARYLLLLFKEQMEDISEEEFDITPMKLQKLLYYCQGYSLALTGKPMFEEEIEAWQYGPVVPFVYREYQAYGGRKIPLRVLGDVRDIDDVAASIARLVVREKGNMSGIALANMTHGEAPWKDTYAGRESGWFSLATGRTVDGKKERVNVKHDTCKKNTERQRLRT